jgi:CheY-like chemotaxis protein
MDAAAASPFVGDHSIVGCHRSAVDSLVAIAASERAPGGLLKSLSYRAVTFQSAEEFLNSKWRHRAACSIADVQMPGMTGPELHNRLVASGKPIPTVHRACRPASEAARRISAKIFPD